MTNEFELFQGDCEKVISAGKIPNRSVNLIVTSPPYADQRKNTYGGVHPDEYVNWFLSKTASFQKILTGDGSFILNIKENAVNGERHPYVYELVLAMRRKQAWRLVDEYCWHKKDAFPGKWRNRFRDAWERCYHFTLNPEFKMRQEAVMVPIGEWSDKRLKNLSENDLKRRKSKTNSGFGARQENWVKRNMVYPSNVLHLGTVSKCKNHPAVFPKAIPDWFIRLFTDEGDTVLDPFAGSGTTMIAALENKRKAIGIEMLDEYCNLIRTNINKI